MGCGPLVNGKYRPITPWNRSWAQTEEQRKLARDINDVNGNKIDSADRRKGNVYG
jgi:hypothetical protein